MQAAEPRPATHPQPPTLPSHNQPEPQGPQQEEAEDPQSVRDKEAERVGEEAGKDEEEEAGAPGGLSSDWTRGSVRRVTRQLEQRMKQEQETPALSSSPPSASAGPHCCPPRRPASVHLASASDASPCLQVALVDSVREEPEAAGKEEGGAEGGNSAGSAEAPKPSPPDCRAPLSSSLHRSALSPLASVNFLCLEGVTQLETATDWEQPAEGPQCQDDLKETWETLCELRAFLQQVSGGGGTGGGGAFSAWCGADRADQSRGGRSVQRRVSEVEARIRQAGLTPPSLMKRSASLAKLGCLELLANELSEWERRRSPVPPSSAEPHAVSDEAKKKQRVQSSAPSADQQAHGEDADSAGRHSEAGEISPLPPPAPQTSLSSEELPAGRACSPELNSHLLPSALKSSKQQYGRTHPLRRLKKRTTSTLYHTM